MQACVRAERARPCTHPCIACACSAYNYNLPPLHRFGALPGGLEALSPSLVVVAATFLLFVTGGSKAVEARSGGGSSEDAGAGVLAAGWGAATCKRGYSSHNAKLAHIPPRSHTSPNHGRSFDAGLPRRPPPLSRQLSQLSLQQSLCSPSEDGSGVSSAAARVRR